MDANPYNDTLFRVLVEHSSDLILIVDREATIRYASPAVARILRRESVAVVGTSLLDLLVPGEVIRAHALLEGLVAGGSSSPVEWCFKLPNGTGRNLETIATNLLADPHVQGIVLNSRDVTERKALEEQLAHRAFHDGLTGLANRALFYDRIVHAQARASRDGGQVAVLFLDLDDFKTVNDSLGHTAGDLLLVAVAQRLQSALRAADTVARFGGDEFAILIEDVRSIESATALAEHLLAECRVPLSLGDQEMFVRMSIGVALTRPGQQPDELMREADVALYAAKAKGKGRYDIFDADMDARARERLQIEVELRRALSQGELVVELAQALDVTVTGEGIETATQEAELRSLGCDGGQGYLFTRPLPAGAMQDLLTDGISDDLLEDLAA